MNNTNLANLNLVSNKMNINFNVLGTTMLDWIRRKIYCGNIFTIDNCRPIDGLMQFLKELSNPGTFCNNMSYITVLCFNARPGHG
jgi:hypothetical protein